MRTLALMYRHWYTGTNNMPHEAASLAFMSVLLSNQSDGQVCYCPTELFYVSAILWFYLLFLQHFLLLVEMKKIVTFVLLCLWVSHSQAFFCKKDTNLKVSELRALGFRTLASYVNINGKSDTNWKLEEALQKHKTKWDFLKSQDNHQRNYKSCGKKVTSWVMKKIK